MLDARTRAEFRQKKRIDKCGTAAEHISYEEIAVATASLVKKGILFDTGMRRPGRHGKPEAVYALTKKGREMAESTKRDDN